jgi:hypothetical protein
MAMIPLVQVFFIYSGKICTFSALSGINLFSTLNQKHSKIIHNELLQFC